MKGKRPSAFGRKPPKSKPPAKESMEAMVGRKLTNAELDERSRRLARKQVELKSLKGRKRSMTREIADEIKAVEAEIDTLAQQIVDGEELVKQGDLFADGSASKVPSQGQAVKGVVDVAKHAGVTPPADGKGPQPAA